MVKTLNIQSKIRLCGLRQDVEALIPSMDVIALSSKREGLPLSLLEGMAHGIPAVATAVGEIPQLVRDGGGIAVSTEDVAAFSDALSLLHDNPGERKAKGRAARALVERTFLKKNMAARYVSLYKKLVH